MNSRSQAVVAVGRLRMIHQVQRAVLMIQWGVQLIIGGYLK